MLTHHVTMGLDKRFKMQALATWASASAAARARDALRAEKLRRQEAALALFARNSGASLARVARAWRGAIDDAKLRRERAVKLSGWIVARGLASVVRDWREWAERRAQAFHLVQLDRRLRNVLRVTTLPPVAAAFGWWRVWATRDARGGRSPSEAGSPCGST